MGGPHDYVPWDDRPFRLRMGLRPLDLDRWLEPDDRRDDELALKGRLLAERYDDVVAIVDAPAVHAAADELWALVRDALPRSVPQLSASAPTAAGQNGPHHPIVRCGSATQEDWCLLVDLGRGPVLAAACVCFPTRWILRAKIGLPMAAVHAPVAHYDDHLAAPVDSFLDRLTVDHPVWRLNWNLVDDPALFQPVRAGGAGRNPHVTPDNAGDRVLLRVERQTLRRLPATGAIAFSIRVHQRPVSAITDRRDLASLRAAIANLPADTYDYKDIGAFGDALEEWLARTA